MSWETLIRQISISGQITAVTNGKGIPEATVEITAGPTQFTQKARIQAKQHGTQWKKMSHRYDRTETANDGYFFFLDLPEGDYTLTAYMSGRSLTYDYAQNSGQLTSIDGAIQPIEINIALADYTGKTYPPTFSPSQINNCQLWLQAEALTSYSDGDSVTTWSDSSGQGHDASQNNVDKQPTYIKESINGRPALRFNGSSQYFSLPLSTDTTDHTFCVVYNHTTTGGHSNYIFEAQTGRLTLDCAQSSSPYNMRWQDSDWHSITPATTGSQIVSWVFSGDSGTLYRNGIQIGSDAYTPQLIGGTVTLGANYQGRSSFFEGDIAEFLYYNRALSEEERNLIETYLNGRYAVRE